MKPIIAFVRRLLGKKSPKTVKIPTEALVPRTEHNISKTNISINALKVVNRLYGHGYPAYLVGGSVRDLLLGQTPKDFDVATDASPAQIKKLFVNARIIGKRFKLAHILFRREVIEVATFRGAHKAHTNEETGLITQDNRFGNITEDVWRRDFTINALYYCPQDATIVDFTGGVKDIHQKQIKIIGDPMVRYQEDPVRMIRAVRFAAKLDFNIEKNTADAIAKSAHLLSHVSNHRLFEECCKLFHCGHAVKVQMLLSQFGLFDVLFPSNKTLNLEVRLAEQLRYETLSNTDKRINQQQTVSPAFLFAAFLWHPLLERRQKIIQEGVYPLPALEQAMKEILSEQSQAVNIPKRFTQTIREMWLLQFRLEKRYGTRAFKMLDHARFRAAFDLLCLRAKSGEPCDALASWWTAFQQADEEGKTQMIHELPKAKRKRSSK